MLIIIETIENRAASPAFELITLAEELAGTDRSRIRVIVAGEHVAAAAEHAALYGHDVIALEHPSMRFPNPDLLAAETVRLVEEFRPRYVFLPHTMRGCQAAARVSAATGLSCITGVESFTGEEATPVFRKPVINGKLVIGLAAGGGRAAVTVLPGAYRAPDIVGTPRAPGTLETRVPSDHSSPCVPLGLREQEGESVRLEESDVIIAAGRGIGTKDNLALVRAVAKLFPNAAIGASRTVVDQKWLPYAHQVGVTGKTVAPKLYMACGISGAQQHIAGMKGSRMIVAINRDPHAAIFSIADYIIVEDLTTFLPLLVEAHTKKK